jgi:signal transduction histidine kinase
MGLFGSRKNSDDNRNFHIFEEAQQQAGENVQLVLRKSDLYPIHISPNFKRVLGVEPARMVDDVETLFRFASEEDYATIKRSIREWDGSGTLALNAEYCMPTDPQRRKHLRTTLSPVMNGEYLFAAITDVTHEHQIIEQLEEERAKAEAAASNRTDFMSQMSHEIRTPLNGIKGMIALAQQHHAQEERLMDDLSRASDLSNYLLSLVNDVLDMSRLNSGHVELEHHPFDLRLVASELYSMFEG